MNEPEAFLSFLEWSKGKAKSRQSLRASEAKAISMPSRLIGPGVLPAPGSSRYVAFRPLRLADTENSRLLAEGMRIERPCDGCAGASRFFQNEEKKERVEWLPSTFEQRRLKKRTTLLPTLCRSRGGAPTRKLFLFLAINAGDPAPL